MMSKVLLVFLLFLMVQDVPVNAQSFAAQNSELLLSDKHIVFETNYGDITFGLYPEMAPNHVRQILKLVENGVYDTTHFYRAESGFVLQLSTAFDRTKPLTKEQRRLIYPLRAERNDLKHVRGVLSMAREDNDPHSGETSFSILLDEAQHLDGKYTIFGHVMSGWETIDLILSQPRKQKIYPLERIAIEKSYVVEETRND